MTKDELIGIVSGEVKGLATHFVSNDYTQAANDAERETGFSFPVTNGDAIVWLKRRTKRHLFYMLASESAYKFKFEQINLQHRFQHLFKLVETEDAAFAEAAEDLILADGTAAQMFGHKIDAGFSQDQFGRDTTYEYDNLVAIHPLESE